MALKKLISTVLSAAMLISSFANTVAFAEGSAENKNETQYGVEKTVMTEENTVTVTQKSISSGSTGSGSWFYLGEVEAENLTSVNVTIGSGTSGSNVAGTTTKVSMDENGKINSSDYESICTGKGQLVAYSSTTDERSINITSNVKSVSASESVNLYAWVKNNDCEITVTSVYKPISSSSDLQSFISNGGTGSISEDFTVDNVGIGTTQNTPVIINGNNHIITKPNSKLNDAMVYQNKNSSWKISNLTFNGNKSVVTNTDACLWHMAGTTEYENVVFKDFRTSKSNRGVINTASSSSESGSVTLNNCLFENNECTADVYVNTGSLTLKGTTKAHIYYQAGNIDISGLT